MQKEIINIKCDEPLNYNRLLYTIDFIDNHPLKPDFVEVKLNTEVKADFSIIYSKHKSGYLTIPSQHILFGFNEVKINNLFLNKYIFKTEFVYSVEGNNKSESDLFFHNNSFGFDIFEAIFFHISRFEEVFAKSHQLDEHARMKSHDQILVKSGLEKIPVVDSLVLIFFKSLGFEIQDRPTKFSMTHDIDAIQKFSSWLKLPKSIIRIIMMGLGFNGFIEILKFYFKSIYKKENDPYYVFDSLLTNENFFEDKVIFFVAGGKTRFDLFNDNYLKNLKNIALKASERDYLIGFHPSYNAYNSAEMLEKELCLLKQTTQTDIKFVRTHFLRMDFYSTLKNFITNHLQIDSTLGFSDLIGFRCGTGYKYYIYDFENEHQSKISELPLVVMDSALLYIYCKDDTSFFKKALYSFLEKNKFNTHITFNFHNSTFDRSLKNRFDMLKIYSELITDISNSNLIIK